MIIIKDTVDFRFIPVKQNYPKTFTSSVFSMDNEDENAEVNSEITFRIYAGESKDQNVKYTSYRSISLIGNLPELTLGVEYDVSAIEGEKNGEPNYKVVSIKRKKPMTSEGVRLFLSELLTHMQVEQIMTHYPNIIDIISDGKIDTIDTSKLYGIGDYIIRVIERKILENFKFAEIIAEFDGLLNFELLKKLSEKYTSIEEIKQQIKNNPYGCLTDLNRIGFKIADKTILNFAKECKKKEKNGIKPPIVFDYDILTSKQRASACVEYVLTENENSGHTKMLTEDVIKSVKELAPECFSTILEVLKDKEKYVLKSPFIANKYTYDTEVYIAETLKFALKEENRIKWEFDTKKYQEQFNLTDEQFSMLQNVCDNNVSVLNGFGGCVDCDTEYFNGTEWKKISEYDGLDKVLQYNKDGSSELVEPLKYHKYKEDYLWHFKTKYGIDQCLCDEHEVYYITSKNNLYHKSFKEVRENHEKHGFLGKFITTFNYYSEGLPYNEWEIRLRVAIKSDGSFDKKYPNSCYINIKKDRKKERIEWLLKMNNIPYTIQKSGEGYKKYYFKYEDNEKTFTKKWYSCNKEQFEIIYDEIFYWDGDFKDRDDWSTTIKSDADFIQFVGTVCGFRSTIDINDRVGREYITANKTYTRKSIEYGVNFTKRTLIKLNTDYRKNDIKTPIEKYKTLDGYKYCFTVDSGMLVLRRNNKIFITGNCGKTYTLTSILTMLKDNNIIDFRLSAPTGKATKIVKKYTKEEASTVHKMLEAKGNNIFERNENNKIEADIIFVDEFSMMDIFLTKHLFEAIDFTKTKLVLIGDNNQLVAVACGNVFHNILESNVPKATLNKVFRYNIGGISTIATNTRLMKETIKDKNSTQTVLGDDKAYVYFNMTQDKLIKNTLALYKKLLETNKVEDISVLTSYNKGDYGTIVLNSYLQSIANPKSKIKEEPYIKIIDTKFYIDDIVMQYKNNYKAIKFIDDIETSLIQKRETFISNGDTGKIIDIDFQKQVALISFDEDAVVYDFKQLLDCKHSYASSIHKNQGSQNKIIILLTPKAHTYMLNSNLIYVGLTRATDRVYHFGELETFNRAIKIKENFNRQTFLTELLNN